MANLWLARDLSTGARGPRSRYRVVSALRLLRRFRLRGQYTDEAATLVSRLREHELFQGFPGNKLKDLVPSFRLKEFKDEQISCHCPDAKHDAFIVLSGRVAVIRVKEGEQHVLEIQGEGGVFNFEALLDLAAHYTGSRALGRVELLSIDSGMVGEAATRDANLGFVLMKNLCRLVIEQNERQLDRFLEG